MSLNNFIPTIWSARLLMNLHKSLVYGQLGVINRDYEGEIQAAGDTVRITSIGPVTVGDYTKNTDMTPAQVLSDAQTTLRVDQQKFFNFQIDDIDAAQQQPKVMNGAMMEAAYALANVADQYVAAHYTDVPAANQIGSTVAPITLSATSAYEYLVDLSVRLDENSVPPDGRWVIVPPFYEGAMLKDNRFVAGYSPLQDQARLNAVVGTASGFLVLKSNNVPTESGSAGSVYKVLAGSNIAWTFADQISKVEAYRPQLRFADAVKGLHVYGMKTTRPTAVASLSCYHT